MSVAAPAIFMICNGLLGLVLLGLLSVPCVFDLDMLLDTWDSLVAKLPPGPEKQQAEQDLAAARQQLNAHRDAVVMQNALILLGRAVLDALAIVGGLYMRKLSGYKMSMIGAIVSVIPLATGCCLTGIPFGIWALIVLNRPDVKAAFAARRNAPPHDPDAQYMR